MLINSFADVHRAESARSQTRWNFFCVCYHAVSKGPSRGLFVVTVLLLCGPFKMSLTQCAEALSTVPEHKKAVMCLARKIRMLDMFCSGPSYGTVGCEFVLKELSNTDWKRHL